MVSKRQMQCFDNVPKGDLTIATPGPAVQDLTGTLGRTKMQTKSQTSSFQMRGVQKAS